MQAEERGFYYLLISVLRESAEVSLVAFRSGKCMYLGRYLHIPANSRVSAGSAPSQTTTIATITLLKAPESCCSVSAGNLAINSQANGSGVLGNIKIITQGLPVDPQKAACVLTEAASRGAIVSKGEV